MRSIKLPSWIERLLGFDPMPVPPHVFAVTPRSLAYAGFAREGDRFELRSYRRRELPVSSFQNGILGGPVRNPEAFGETVKSFVEELDPPVEQASLIVPDGWLRVSFLESEGLPAKAEARDDVVRWKLKRLVPFRVEELRLGLTELTPLPEQEEPRRFLVGFGLEQLLAQIEDAFGRAGVTVGQLTNASLSLLAALRREPGVETADALEAVAAVEHGGYTLIFSRGGEPLLHRYKGFTGNLPAPTQASFVARDLRLTHTFLEEHFPRARLERVLLAAPPDSVPTWLEWLGEGLGQPAEALDLRHLPLAAPPPQAPEASPLLGDLATMLGAASLEVT